MNEVKINKKFINPTVPHSFVKDDSRIPSAQILLNNYERIGSIYTNVNVLTEIFGKPNIEDKIYVGITPKFKIQGWEFKVFYTVREDFVNTREDELTITIINRDLRRHQGFTQYNKFYHTSKTGAESIPSYKRILGDEQEQQFLVYVSDNSNNHNGLHQRVRTQSFLSSTSKKHQLGAKLNVTRAFELIKLIRSEVKTLVKAYEEHNDSVDAKVRELGGGISNPEVRKLWGQYEQKFGLSTDHNFENEHLWYYLGYQAIRSYSLDIPDYNQSVLN
tara:strand:- start:1415 stop:2239 length:825 start_codon:yes stop_codon:yes gene_type:complete